MKRRPIWRRVRLQFARLRRSWGRRRWHFAATACLLIGLALASRVWVAHCLANDGPGDGVVYAQLARNLLEQGVFSTDPEPPFKPTLIRLPGYPLFIAAVYSVFGHDNNSAVRIVQGVFDTGTCVIIGWLAWLWTEDERRKKRNTYYAFVLATLCPFVVIYTATLLPETLTTFLMVSITLTTTLALQAVNALKRCVWWAVTGILVGIAVLVRPDSGLFGAAVGIALVVFEIFLGRSSGRQLSRRALAILWQGMVLSTAFLLVLTPWTLRNYRLFGVFQPLAPAHAEMPGEFVPHGYFRWLRTWVDDFRYVEPMLWDLDEKPIRPSVIPANAFDSTEERVQVVNLLAQYNNSPVGEIGTVDDAEKAGNDPATSTSGEENDDSSDNRNDNPAVAMTPEIDARFANIADRRIASSPFRYYLGLPIRRALGLWFDSHSLYYPFGGQLATIGELDYEARQQYWLPGFVVLMWLYTGLAVAGIVFLWRNHMMRWLVLLALMALPRIAFFSTVENPEPRYVVELFAFTALLGGFWLGGSIRRQLLSAIGSTALFGAAAAMVWLQNTRLTVLYDLSGVLEPATRIAQGDLPYRDFPFPYAPLTFLTQAALIDVTGPIYWHHIAYAAIVGGLASLLTWRILAALFRDVPHGPMIAFLLAVPSTVLGVYSIFPHPFYDPDAALVVLFCIWLLLKAEAAGYPPLWSFMLGSLFVVPLFVKQNIGLAFGGSMVLWLLLTILLNLKRKLNLRGHVTMLAGMCIGLLTASLIVNATVGLSTYKYWTWDFATARRAPALGDMLSMYADWSLLLWIALFLFGAYLTVRSRDDQARGKVVGIVLMAMPFLWPVIYLALDSDASERAERLVALWPITLVVVLLLRYVLTRRTAGVAGVLPFILAATVHGVFLSQQLWGSTYGIWPLLILMLGLILIEIVPNERQAPVVLALSVVIASSLTVSGAFYLYSNERLDYVTWSEGEMEHSALPQLQLMSMRGDYLPAFDELVAWTTKNIPRDDGVLCLPGEDLFYYTTGRRPHFPVLLFDVTNNPYTVDEIHQRVVASDIEWLIVKDDLEIEADDMIDSKEKIAESLKPEFRSVETLDNYEIFKRRHPDDPPDEEDSSDPDDADDVEGN